MALNKATPNDDALAEYRKRMELRNAPGWRPAPNTTVRAEVIGLHMGESEYGPYPKIIYRRKEYDGTPTEEVFALHAFHQVLKDRLRELGTDIGKEQFLTYLGTRASGTRVDSKGEAVEYHNYDVENVGETAAAKSEGFTFD